MAAEILKTCLLYTSRRAFRDPSRELTREEYDHLIETARLLGRERLAQMCIRDRHNCWQIQFQRRRRW